MVSTFICKPAAVAADEKARAAAAALLDGDFDGATARCAAILSEDPSHGLALFVLAEARARCGENVDELFERALASLSLIHI